MDESREAAPRPADLCHLAQEEQACRRCPLYRDATQAVPGEGPRRARLMLVGEQPGDREDRPASRVSAPSGRWSRISSCAGLQRQAPEAQEPVTVPPLGWSTWPFM